MTATRIVIATPHKRYDALETALRDMHGFDVMRIRERDMLTPEQLQPMAPRFVFLPHWSWHIPASVFEQFECVVFHMTDLPFGRGGSPLQNLIVRGFRETKLSAIRCVQQLDGGPIYCKQSLLLEGSAEEIFVRAAGLMEEMIIRIVREQCAPEPQTGELTTFKRRLPADGDIAGLDSLRSVHDHIRMLDAEGYPPAFIQIGALKLEFDHSRLADDEVLAHVRIRLVDKGTH
jgi:methionyl-tRNA formyltransferase